MCFTGNVLGSLFKTYGTQKKNKIVVEPYNKMIIKQLKTTAIYREKERKKIINR